MLAWSDSMDSHTHLNGPYVPHYLAALLQLRCPSTTKTRVLVDGVSFRSVSWQRNLHSYLILSRPYLPELARTQDQDLAW